MPEADLSAVLEFCGINNNNHIASSSTSPTRCHDCPAARSLRTSSTFRLQICCKFVCKQTSPFETKDSNVNKGKNSSSAADSFLGVTGSFTVLNDVQDNCTNISGAQKRDEEEGQSTAPVQQGSTTTTRRSRNKECSSKYYGVRFRPDLSKWVAEIRVAEWKSVDKKVWLGTYISEEGAACAVDAARKILKCTKKKKPNFSCDRLEAYTESLPPELSLDNVSDTTIFKAITEFVKCKAKQYASEITSGMATTLPIVKKIRTTTFTPRVHMSNSQPAPAGDELTTSGTTVIQLAGSVNIEFPSISFEPLPYLDHGVNAIEVQMPMNNTSSPVPSHEYEQRSSPFHVTSVARSMGMADNFLKEEHHGKELNLEGYGVTPLLSSSMMFSQGASSLDWPRPQQSVSAAPIGSEVILHQEPFFMNVEDGLNVMLSHELPEPNTYWPVDDQIFNLDFNYNETLGDSDVWVENYLGSCSEQSNDTIMLEQGRETKLVPSFTMSSQGDGINSCMDAFLQGTVPANSHENSNQPT